MEENGTRYATEAALARLDSKVEQSARDISDTKADVTKLFTMYDNFASLPETMNRLEKTLVAIEVRLGGMSEKLNCQGEELNKQKERGKIDIVGWLADHWWGIVFAAATAFFIIKQYLT